MSYSSRLDKKKSKLKRRLLLIISICFISSGIYLIYDLYDKNNKSKSEQTEIIKIEKKIPKPEQDITVENSDVENKNIDTFEENMYIESYPEATASISKVFENMNAIYVEANKLKIRLTSYDQNNSFSYIKTVDLKKLYEYSSNVSNEVTSSAHFQQPNFTVPDYRQVVESNRIIVRELNQLNDLIKQYPRKFQENPKITLNQAKNHLEQIKLATQSKLPGFEKIFKSVIETSN